MQSEVDKVVLSTADPRAALREITKQLHQRTGAMIALLARWDEEEESGTTLLAHVGVGAALADKLCVALAHYGALSSRSDKPIVLASTDKVVLSALPDGLRKRKIGRLMVLPLHRAGKPLGLLVLARHLGSFGAASIRIVEETRANLTLLVEQIGQLEKIAVYSNFANFDGLTGLHTHRYFQETLSKEIARAERLGHPVSLMMIDIDRFKLYNDTFGHPQGDVALKEIANVLKKSIRSYDLAARYGGEEMVIVLPQTSAHRALAMAERIRGVIAELPFRGANDSHRVQLTISLGVAGLPANAKCKSELIERADQALYLAKAEGRNRVAVSLMRSRKSIRFAYCPPAFTSSYYVDVLTGVRDVIEELGGIELIARAPNKESDHSRLVRICRTLVRSGVDAVALASTSSAIAPLVRALNRARVPVFFFNVPRKISGARVVSYVGYRQEEAGREVGRYLARVLRGQGSILILKGLADASSIDRVAGFRTEIARYPKMKVVATRQADWEREKARRAVERALAEYPLDAIYAVSDEMALGASDAVAAAGRRGEIFVVGLDGTRSALQAIREGALTATLNTNPREMGRILMRTVVRGLGRRERVETEILSPINIVDLGNVGHH